MPYKFNPFTGNLDDTTPGPTGATGTVAAAGAGTAAAPSISFAADTNTGIFSPGADQVAISTNGTGRLFVDASGSVGLGTSQNPTAGVVPRPVLFLKQFSDSGFAGIHIEASGDQSILGIGYDGTAQVFEFGTSFRGTGANRPIIFKTTGSECMRIASSGSLLVGKTTTTANGGVIQTSNGITFPATAVACSDVNTLDDYEEGTFTPVLGDHDGGVATMSTQEGKYVKVGKIVQFSLQIVWSAKNTWTGANARISGLPFAVTSNTGSYSWPNAATMNCNLTTTAFNYAVEPTTTHGFLMDLLGNQIDASNWPSTGRSLVNGVYQIA